MQAIVHVAYMQATERHLAHELNLREVTSRGRAVLLRVNKEYETRLAAHKGFKGLTAMETIWWAVCAEEAARPRPRLTVGQKLKAALGSRR